MKKLPLLFLLVAACAGQQRPTCTAESLDALRSLYTHAAKDIIESGACDKYSQIQDCPSYLVLEKHFEVAGAAMCGGGK